MSNIEYDAAMNGRDRIGNKARRAIVLSVLYEDEPQAVLAREYGVDKSHVSRLVADAREAPELKLRKAEEALKEAEREVRFRKRVMEILEGDTWQKAKAKVRRTTKEEG